MTKKLIATVLAASIALTSVSALPAAAKPNDGAKILGGLAALYILSRVIKDNDRRRPAPAPVQPTVPNRCLKTFYTPKGAIRAYGAHCVAKQAPRLSLPQQCKRRINTDYGRRNVYGPYCLRENGYRVAVQ